VVIAVFLKIEVGLKAHYHRARRAKKKGGTVFFCPPTFSARQKAKPVPIIFETFVNKGFKGSK